VRNTPVAATLLTLASQCFAFQACPGNTRPCASPLQVLLYVGLPTFLLLVAGTLAHRKLAARWVRVSVLVTLGIFWALVGLVALATFNAFLAPCASFCWYKP